MFGSWLLDALFIVIIFIACINKFFYEGWNSTQEEWHFYQKIWEKHSNGGFL